MRGRESGEGDGGQNRMSDEKAEMEGGGERRRKRGREMDAGSLMRGAKTNRLGTDGF